MNRKGMKSHFNTLCSPRLAHSSGHLIYDYEFYIILTYMANIKNMQALKNNNSNNFLKIMSMKKITC